jgi:hypothetical protein
MSANPTQKYLQQIASYRTSTGSYLSRAIFCNIDPTSWFFVPANQAGSSRCGNFNCYTAGDYMRSAENTSLSATLSFIAQSTVGGTNDLEQSFVKDPEVGAVPVPGLVFGPLVPFGSDSTYKGVLDDLAARTPSHEATWTIVR